MATINVKSGNGAYIGTGAADIFNNAQEADALLNGAGGIDTYNFDDALTASDDASAQVSLSENGDIDIANAEILNFTNGSIDLTSGEDQYLTVATGGANTFSAEELLAYNGEDNGVGSDTDFTVQSVNGQAIESGQAISVDGQGSLAYNDNGDDPDTLTFTAFTGYASSLGYGETGEVDLDVTYINDEDEEVTVTYTATVDGEFSEGDDVYRASSTEVDDVSGEDDVDLLNALGGNDTISGDQGADAIYGGAGDDDIYAGPLDDGMNGDTFAGGAGDDEVYGGAGNDTLTGDDESRISDLDDSLSFDGSLDGSDTIFGGAGDDEIHTGSWDEDTDTQTGTADDVAFGGAGDDLIAAARGDDTLGGGDGNDDIRAGSGDDIVYGGDDDGADIVRGAEGNDTIYGGDGVDDLRGQADDDLIFNGAGNDAVRGGSGNDTLWGGAGDDTLTGDAPNGNSNDSDVFAFVAGNGTDTITDFASGIDQIDLSELGLSEDDLEGMMGTIGGENAVFYGDGDAIILQGASVDADDFIL